jgi:FRG domain-containing protein
MRVARRVWAVQEFLNKVASIQKEWQKIDKDVGDTEWLPWFRGEANASWPTRLMPKLYRREVATEKGRKQLLYADQELRLAFQRHAAQLVAGRALDEWERYFMMQAYGAPTRLLDWTDGALAALYFAIQSRGHVTDPEKEADASVYMLDPWWLNAKTFKTRVRPWDEGVALSDWKVSKPYLPEAFSSEQLKPRIPLAIDPVHLSSRMAAQRAHFTIFGYDPRGLISASARRDSRLVQIPISQKAIPEIQKQLKLAGISEVALFPDLEGLGRELSYLWEDLVRQAR